MKTMVFSVDHYSIKQYIKLKTYSLFYGLIFASMIGSLLPCKLFGATQRPHTHGQAEATLIIDENQILLEFAIPALSVIGFEHSPQTIQEKNNVQTAHSAFLNASLVTFSNESKWFKTKEVLTIPIRDKTVSLETPILDEESSRHHNHDHPEDSECSEGNHLEFIITQVFNTHSTPHIDTLTTTLFEIVPDLDRLNITIISENAQWHQVLTKNHHSIQLKQAYQ